jgi:hypothetical protein
MPADGPNLVLATAWNIGVPDVYVFVQSLRRHYHGDAMMLVTSRGSTDLVRYLKSQDITPVYFDCTYWMVMHVQLSRYVRYEEILRGSTRQYERVLLSDSSDVLFQANPFEKIPDDPLLCFLEGPGRTIGQSENNRSWVEQIYGADGLEKIKNFEISCSGTTIGSHQAIVEYIGLLLQPAKPNVMVPLMKYRGHDQGIHNYLLRTGALPKARLVPNGQIVYTVGYVHDSNIALGPDGTILAPGAHLCPIIHQYNYKPALLAHVNAAYPLPR